MGAGSHAEAETMKQQFWSELGPIIDGLPYSGVCFLDLNGMILALSDGACKFLGYQESELVGQSIDVLSTPEDRASGKMQTAMATVRQSGMIDNRRWAVRKDAGRVLIDGPLLGRYDSGGQLVGFAEVMRNVTERAQAGGAMRKSEQRYRMLFDAMDEGFCIIEVFFNGAGKPTAFDFVETNPAFHELTGVSLQETRTRHVVIRHDREFWFAAATRVLDSGKPLRFETQASESGRWFDMRAWQISDDTSTQIAVILTDITERKNSDVELLTTAQRYQALFEFMPTAVYTCDADGVLQDYNERAVELWGREPNSDGVVDTYCAALRLYYPNGSLMPHEQCPTARALRGEALSDKDYELKIERPDGSFRNVGLYPRVLKDDHGRIIGAINNLYDFTDRARSEEALRQRNAAVELHVMQLSDELKLSRTRVRRAFEMAPIPGCLTSLQNGFILSVNQPFTTLLGYTPEEVVGRTTQELGLWSSQQDQAALAAGIKQEEGVDTYRELRLQVRTKQGGVRDILASGETIELDGQPAWLRLFMDVTERKRTEEELAEAIEEVMSDANWFSISVVQRLADLRKPNPNPEVSMDLTQREQQVLKQIARGRSDSEIAADMGIARSTVRNYVASIYDKIDVHTRVEAVVWARERGMLT